MDKLLHNLLKYSKRNKVQMGHLCKVKLCIQRKMKFFKLSMQKYESKKRKEKVVLSR